MLPILPLKTVLVPDITLTVQIEEGRYRSLVERCAKNEKDLVVVFCSDYNNELASLSKVGCKARVERIDTSYEGVVEVRIKALERVRFSETLTNLNIHYAMGVGILKDIVNLEVGDPLLASVFKVYQSYISELADFNTEMLQEEFLSTITPKDSFKFLSSVSLTLKDRQKALEITFAKERFEFILSCLHLEIDMLSFFMAKTQEANMVKVVLN